MGDKSILASPPAEPPILRIGLVYSANDTAAILGIAASVLNERVRQGLISPVFSVGDRTYSGYTLAKLLGWPISDNPDDYLPGREPVKPVGPVPGPVPVRRRRRRSVVIY